MPNSQDSKAKPSRLEIGKSLATYCMCGAMIGMVGMIFAMVAVQPLRNVRFQTIDSRDIDMDWSRNLRMSLPLLEESMPGSFLAGGFCGLGLRYLSLRWWSKAEQPFAAAFLSATLGGSFALVAIGSMAIMGAVDVTKDLGMCAFFVTAYMVCPAAFGFLTALAARGVNRRWKLWPGQ
jgi:hypothetical protein